MDGVKLVGVAYPVLYQERGAVLRSLDAWHTPIIRNCLIRKGQMLSQSQSQPSITFEVALSVIERGIHLLVEKPLGFDG